MRIISYSPAGPGKPCRYREHIIMQRSFHCELFGHTTGIGDELSKKKRPGNPGLFHLVAGTGFEAVSRRALQ
jgi:hypothetical protein